MIDEQTYHYFLTNLIEGNKATCTEVLKNILALNPDIKEVYENLFRRSLYKVGELWELNKISVATEHMATAIIENLMIHLQPRLFNIDRIGKKAVIACTANEYHQVGTKMIADIFEMHGWDGYFVGANTPVGELIRFIDVKQPDTIGLSLSIYFNLNVFKETLQQIRKTFPGIPVIIGGQAFNWGGKNIVNEFDQVYYLDSLGSLESFILKQSQSLKQ